MNRRKLIRKLVIPAIIIFVVAIIGLLSESPVKEVQYKIQVKKLESHIAKLTQHYQDYLTAIAQGIRSIPVSPDIVGKIQSEVLKEEPTVKLYLWMSGVNGEFTFGTPTAVFKRLNQAFNKYKETILAEGYYMDRNDFLIKLVDLHKYVDFSEFNTPIKDKNEIYWWREYNELMRLKSRGIFRMHKENRFKFSIHSGHYSRPRSFVLSAPVTDSQGNGIGNLYLKIDDSNNHEMYYAKWGLRRQSSFNTIIEIFRVLAIFSGLFLWFLVPTWVYIDATQSGVKNPLAWAVFTLISFIIFGLTIYLITRPTTLKSFHCPQCENELNGTKAYCPYCGYDLSTTFCPQCQYPIKQQWQFCPSCRAELKQEKPEIVERKPEVKKVEKEEKEKKDN